MIPAKATQRRTFRGRGGPTDRRLPKHQARRRRRHPTAVDAAENSDSEGRLYHLDSNHLEQCGMLSEESSGEEASGETDSAVDFPEEDSESPVLAESIPESATAEDETAAAFRREMVHLRQRIANVQTAFKSITMADPTTYRTNVLNATLNCCNQWRHIVNHYNPTATDARRGGQWVFELVQASLQTGPLAGAKAGYFKRCGCSVATLVHAYLYQICTSAADAVTELFWTEKQASAWETWTRKALQASESDSVEPSKSVQTKHGQAMQKKQAKQQKREAKKKQLGLV